MAFGAAPGAPNDERQRRQASSLLRGDDTAKTLIWSGQPLLVWAGVLLGLGVGGFFDGIVFHQLLQWHHLLSSVAAYPVTTVAGLKVNTFWDGVFHAGTYLVTLVGLALLWQASRQPHCQWPTRLLLGLVLLGWGAFNLVEGLIDHELLGLHHVNETVPRSQWIWWDLGFLGWGALMLLAGWALARSGVRPPTDVAGTDGAGAANQ
jgi:uncharacterized membrane protein